jgi:DNA-binding protein Fis
MLNQTRESVNHAVEPSPATLDVRDLVRNLLSAKERGIYRKVCVAVDRFVLEAVLRQVKGSQVQASELLGISRTTLRAKLRSLGMAIEKQPVCAPGEANES